MFKAIALVKLKVTVEWLKVFIRIQEVPISKLSTED
jgi:hypothetical protein